MPSKRNSFIVTLVAKIHAALGLDLAKPLDVVDVVKRLGGRIEHVGGNTMQHEACIVKEGEGFAIRLKEGYRPRESFSIAHELGHLFLHMGYIIDQDRFDELPDGPAFDRVSDYSLGRSEEEYEANEFASELLMPRAQFLDEVRNHSKGGRCNVTELATRFGVSRQAAVTRGRWLGVFSWE